ncbi:hypothetical protein G5I_02436 [Acromyrmex echinatior]|uniref:Uncharacterized protein n=1 Tax=Acromyrmex echinatior TaxID=103372 RepID=F4WAA6_ACREC|nr:hypothetical protein G5I_02436 [Acromyrmex echinatior]
MEPSADRKRTNAGQETADEPTNPGDNDTLSQEGRSKPLPLLPEESESHSQRDGAALGLWFSSLLGEYRDRGRLEICEGTITVEIPIWTLQDVDYPLVSYYRSYLGTLPSCGSLTVSSLPLGGRPRKQSRNFIRGESGDWPASHPASSPSPVYIHNMDSTKKDMTQREVGCSSWFPGGSVPAPGRSTPTGESCERQVAELPAGSAADMATAEERMDWGVYGPDPSTRSKGPSGAATVPDSQDTVLMVSDSENKDSVGVRGPGPRIISNARLPRELRLRVVDGDIVNSSVTAVETSDVPIVIDSSEMRSSVSGFSHVGRCCCDPW